MSTPTTTTPRSEPGGRSGGRSRSSARGVHVLDRVAELTITVGGVAVIVAVLGICVYLAAQVLPLFRSGEIGAVGTRSGAAVAGSAAAWRTDEYLGSVFKLNSDGGVRNIALGDGATLGEGSALAEGMGEAKVTATALEPISGLLALGLSDGRVSLGRIGFDTSFVTGDDITPAMKSLAVGAELSEPSAGERVFGSVVQRLSADQFRRIALGADMKTPAELNAASGGSGGGAVSVHAMDYRESTGREFLVAVLSNGSAALELVTTIRPLGGGKPRTTFEEYPIPFKTPSGRGLPEWVFITGDGQSVLALWKDGFVQRYATRNPETTPVRYAEEMTLLPPGRTITTASMLLGGLTLVLGDDAGFVTRAFVAVDPSATTVDGQRVLVAGTLKVSDEAVSALGSSVRDRCLAVADARGNVGVVNTTSEKWVIPMGRVKVEGGVVPGAGVTISPKVDGLVTLSPTGKVGVYTLDKGFPEASVKSLFGKVHYEGQAAPEFVYQSSSGEDTSELKYSLVPLIHGTAKATIFAMLFAVPMGVLGAIYTSEFLTRGARRIVKPTIEMMASLPSVVLGFIAAIVVAPLVAEHLPAVLMVFFALPVGLLLGGYVWQLIPRATVKRIPGTAKLAAMLAVFGASIAGAWLAGPIVQRVLFVPTQEDRWVMSGSHEPVPTASVPEWVGGRPTMSGDDRRRLRGDGLYFVDGRVVAPKAPADEAARAAVEHHPAVVRLREGSIRAWLDGNFGSAFPGWFLILLGPAAIVSVLGIRATIGPTLDTIVESSPQMQGSLIELARFVGVLGLSAVVSALAARALDAAGIDARDSIVGSFSQRNTLVVGLMMGFAIVPIIYTISEDAMAAVPSSLRSASLGAGATPWQTAVLVVMPVAASGIFSAIMIGFGRAVGETMIVVMATGNTPDMSWNMFSGCRTLSANIATELPEAARGDVHYRILFLCGLVLFVATFALNTTAEIIRQRFRKRSAAL
jgi:phosphate transport system permease protein